MGSDIWMTKNGKIYIPKKDDELQLRICLASHCGLGGHRGLTATSNIVKEKLQWPTMDADIKAFVQSCLVCTLSSSGSKVSRPLGQQIHAQRVSELLRFDFLYVGESRTGHEYILILKDDFSGYVFFATLQKSGCRNHGQRIGRVLHHFIPVL